MRVWSSFSGTGITNEGLDSFSGAGITNEGLVLLQWCRHQQ